ncbi:MAG TPA: hypothetical protein VF950_14685 [Planctomycetota bacterium]
MPDRACDGLFSSAAKRRVRSMSLSRAFARSFSTGAGAALGAGVAAAGAADGFGAADAAAAGFFDLACRASISAWKTATAWGVRTSSPPPGAR